MKRRILFFTAIFAFVLSTAFAFPFGLKMGMTLEEIQEVCGGVPPEQVEGSGYVILPEERDDAFSDYCVGVDEKFGLYCVSAIQEVVTGDDGAELQAAFYERVHKIEAEFGRCEIRDEVTEKRKTWHKKKNWLKGLQNGARVLYAAWPADYGAKMKDDIALVALYARSDLHDNNVYNYITAIYFFSNMDEVADDMMIRD